MSTSPTTSNHSSGNNGAAAANTAPVLLAAPVIISTHVGPDLDALASLVAAGKLYPEAILIAPVLPDFSEDHYFLQNMADTFSFKQAKDYDLSTVIKLIAVDTRQKSRLPHIAAALDNPNLEVHVYDHHPDSDNDLDASVRVVKEWGSATTILVHMLQERNIQLSVDEATLLGAGIYVDTGAFTFATTTEHDFTAVLWLYKQGMQTTIIAELLDRDLSREQVKLLSTMLEAVRIHSIKGVPVLLLSVAAKEYIDDFALLVHRVMRMESAKVIFALCRMDEKVQLTARSQIPDIVDVAQICTSFGGGGHAYAASASIKDKTLSQVQEELLALLFSSVRSDVLLRNHISWYVRSVDDSYTIRQAEQVMLHYRLKAVPVVEEKSGKCIGIIEYQTTNLALAHGLGDALVVEYIQRNIDTVTPDDDMYAVAEIIVGKRQRLVPVVVNNVIVGVVTRTDLINTLVDEPDRIPDLLFGERRQERNIASLMQSKLPKETIALLRMAGALADSMDMAVFAVGGFVRDLLLGRENLDIDLSVEGDGTLFADALAAKLHGQVRQHPMFKTAVITYVGADGATQYLDVATARLEYYKHPAALPVVELSSIKMDLYRRDFTINALALQLNAAYYGGLVDFFGAQADIKQKTIRVLHSLSFVEDPTRILRAVRFEQRFGFTLGKGTERLLRNALSLRMFEKLSKARLFSQFVQVLEEKEAVACLERLHEFGILEEIHPLLRITPTKRALLLEVDKMRIWQERLYLEEKVETWIPFMLTLCTGGKYSAVAAVLQRLNLTESAQKHFLTLREQVRSSRKKLTDWFENNGKMSALCALLRVVPLEGVLYMMAYTKNEEMRAVFSKYISRLRFESLEITGNDLLDLGLSPGPIFKQVLQKVLDAKLDGVVQAGHAEQLALAKEFLETLENA